MTAARFPATALLGPLTALLVGGPGNGVTMPLELESTGFPPVHLSVPGLLGAVKHVYVAVATEPGPLIRYRYRGPIGH